jgi:hypothetical protein
MFQTCHFAWNHLVTSIGPSKHLSCLPRGNLRR